MNKDKLYLATIVLSVILASSLTYAVTQRVLHVHQDPKLEGNVYALYEGLSSSYYIPSTSSGNLVTDIYEHYLRDLQGFDNVTDRNVTAWISLSNDATPLVTWTKLPNEVTANGFDRKLGTVTAWMNGTDHAYNVTYKFTATGSQQLQCAGSNWNGTDDSDNNLAAAATFAQTTFGIGENLTITWVWTYDAN